MLSIGCTTLPDINRIAVAITKRSRFATDVGTRNLNSHRRETSCFIKNFHRGKHEPVYLSDDKQVRVSVLRAR